MRTKLILVLIVVIAILLLGGVGWTTWTSPADQRTEQHQTPEEDPGGEGCERCGTAEDNGEPCEGIAHDNTGSPDIDTSGWKTFHSSELGTELK